MELAALVPETFLAGAKSTEVFHRLWDYMIIELEVDTAGFGWQTSQSAWTCQVRMAQRSGSTNNNTLDEETERMAGQVKERGFFFLGGGAPMLTWLTVCSCVLDVEERSDTHLCGR
jgi:hypothetical protein